MRQVAIVRAAKMAAWVVVSLLPGMTDPDSKLHDLWEEDTTKLKHDTYKVPWPVLYAYASLF